MNRVFNEKIAQRHKVSLSIAPSGGCGTMWKVIFLICMSPTPYELIQADSILHMDDGIDITLTDRMQVAINKICMDREVMDWKEGSYIRHKSNLDLFRRRLREYEDTPMLKDNKFRETNEIIDANIAFNRLYDQHLKTRLLWEPDRAHLIVRVIVENQELCDTWDALRTANQAFYYVTVRRDALWILRNKLGEDAFQRGEMPPAVPYWSFRDDR